MLSDEAIIQSRQASNLAAARAVTPLSINQRGRRKKKFY
ncbi:hypothetical protein A2U01_0106942, partial [Trifolium medium]|nr:hypothetical protein [Trifolium medium]